jgi:gluconate 2-dehydrogenase gamma chain
MDRRKSLKLIATSALVIPVAIAGCNTDEQKEKKPLVREAEFSFDRNPDELKYERELLARDKFFSDHEMATITILSDIIIPRDDVSGSASDAGVPAFIEFIVKDMPDHQLPMRGGLRWLDIQSLKQFGNSFKEITAEQRVQLIDQIAFPAKAKPEMKAGVNFFNLMRNLTATGFYTSAIGIKDINYMGNQPNQWNGVPADVLAQYKLAYTEKELRECI